HQHAGERLLAPRREEAQPGGVLRRDAALDAVAGDRAGRRRGGAGAVLEGAGGIGPRPQGARPHRLGWRPMMTTTMKPEDVMERINVVTAHAWLVRHFLKHADEVQEDEGLLDVHRTIFDFIRAAEPSYERKDAREYLHRVKGKLSKLRRAAEHLEREWRNVST